MQASGILGSSVKPDTCWTHMAAFCIQPDNSETCSVKNWNPALKEASLSRNRSYSTFTCVLYAWLDSGFYLEVLYCENKLCLHVRTDRCGESPHQILQSVYVKGASENDSKGSVKNHLFWLVIMLWCCWVNTWVRKTACSWLNHGFTTLQHKDNWGKQYLHLQPFPLRAGTSGLHICLAGLWDLQRERILATPGRERRRGRVRQQQITN